MKKKKKTPKNKVKQEKQRSSPWMKTLHNTVLLLLVAAICFTVYTYRGEITTENLRQFFASIRLFSAGSEEEIPIQFPASASNRFASFKKGLVLANGEQVLLFSPSGNEELCVDLALSSPLLFASEKYVFAFSLGDTQVSVIDSLSVSRTVNSDLPVYGGAFDDKGGLVLVNESASGQSSCVTLYDTRFRQLWRQNFSSRFVACADVNARGDCAVAAYDVANGDYVSQLLCFSSKGETLFSLSLPKLLILHLEYLADGDLVIGENRALVLDAKTGTQTNETEYRNYRVKSIRSSTQGVALTLELGDIAGRGRVICIDEKGRTAADLTLNDTPLDALWDGRTAYVLGLGVCRRYETDGTRLSDLDTEADATALLPVSDRAFYIIHANHAEKVTVSAK